MSVVFIAALLAASVTPEDLLNQAEQKIREEQFAAAEPILVRAQKLDPSHLQVLYRLGYVRYRQRKLAAARQDFVTVVKSAPPAYYSRYFLGRIALLENKPQEAVTWLEPILTAGEPVFDTAAQLAAAYAASGVRDKAVSALRTAIAGTPWDAALYYRLGRLHAQTGEKELAAEALENSRRLRNASREDVEILMQVSQLLASGKRAEALQAAAKIRDRAGTDPNALVALGVIYGAGNLQAEALDAFERAAAADPRFFQAQYNRGLALLKLNRSAEAEQALAVASDLLPQSLDASRALGLAAVMNQRYADAIAPLERVWHAGPSNARVGALLATAFLRTGAPAKAAAILSADVFRSCTEPAPWLLRVEALNAAEDSEGALGAAQEAQKCFPGNAQVQLAAAQQLARLGRYQDAGAVFAQTLKLAPGYPEAELGLADALARSGDHERALAHYRAAFGAPSTALAAPAGAARSLVALRRVDEARQVLEEAVASHPSEVTLHIELARVYARLGQSALAAEHTKIVDKLSAEAARP